MKNPVTPAGIEPATFRFVAQHLNHCVTAVPHSIIYNRPNLTVGSTDSPLRILSFVVTGNVKLQVNQIHERTIIEVRPLHVYYHKYLSHVSLMITSKSVVSNTARTFCQTPVYYRPSLFFLTCSCQSQLKIVSEPSLGQLHGHISDQASTAVRLMYVESFRGSYVYWTVHHFDS